MLRLPGQRNRAGETHLLALSCGLADWPLEHMRWTKV
jgi:hypothetical protein